MFAILRRKAFIVFSLLLSKSIGHCLESNDLSMISH